MDGSLNNPTDKEAKTAFKKAMPLPDLDFPEQT